MNNVTVIIHSYNEEKNIVDCIRSAQLLTKEIILVDMNSQDKTSVLARENGVSNIFYFPHSNYVEPAREFGINNAKTNWVFLLDTDERITQILADEIKTIIESDQFSFYKVPRKNIFGKKQWLKHGGWWPDQQTRLINRHYFKSWPKAIHSTPIIEGKMGYLKNSLLHYFHGDIEGMVEKTQIFEDIESGLLFQADRPVNVVIFFRKFLGELYRRLFKHKGFLDGEIGIIESIYQAFSKTITYLYLYEKKNRCSL